MARLRTVAGLAAAVVPFAILVHLVDEALSLGSAALGSAFIIRHIYLGVVFVATAMWFGRTVGLGAGPAERRRRCALIGAQLRAKTSGVGFVALAGANLAFFAVSQLIEGVPIASGDWCFGLVAAFTGALLSALFVHICGRSLFIAALAVIVAALRERTSRPTPTTAPLFVAPRRAATIFSLFVPNRPPPAPFLVWTF